MMKALATILFCAACAVLFGCRTPHLGSDFGTRYREALAAQTEKPAEGPAPLDAEDAASVLSQHRAAAGVPRSGPTAPVVIPIQ